MGFITTVSNPLLGRVKLNTWDVSKEIIQAKNAREAVFPRLSVYYLSVKE
jgi:hypothetical protein